MTSPALRTRVYLYPEDVLVSGPRQLAELVGDLGFDGVSIALTYHRGRRVFARQGRVDTLLGGGLAFTPGEGYGRIRPVGDADSTRDALIDEFRAACADLGLGFGVWLVALYVDELVRVHSDLVARTADGGSLGSGLCPSHPESVEYVAALVRDVCERFAPDVVELEAALYPGWEPSFTQTISLVDLPLGLRRLLAQCFCTACLLVAKDAGVDGLLLQERIGQRVARWLSAESEHGEAPGADLDHLVTLRSHGAARMVRAAAAAAQPSGAVLRVLGFGDRTGLELQGFTPDGVGPAPALGLGYGTLSGQALQDRAAGIRDLLGERTAAASVNWSPSRSAATFADDVSQLAAAGADALSVYHLSLVPVAALSSFASAAHAWLEARQ
ncbi:MAG: hypothetical protein ACRDO1_02245 [Nocardioidaceae bacterium]